MAEPKWHNWCMLMPTQVLVQCNEDKQFTVQVPTTAILVVGTTPIVNPDDIRCQACGKDLNEGFGYECRPDT